MKTTRFIATFLCLSLLFNNMAWAMDECSLTTECQLIDNTANSSENSCNTLCAGWTHLHYISFKTPIIDATKTHSDVAQRSFIYRSSQVTSRIRSQVIKRYARMGDAVKTGQKLLTLSSVDMADAQRRRRNGGCELHGNFYRFKTS